MFTKKRIMCLALSVFCMALFSTAYADLDTEDIADIVKMVKEGKGFSETGKISYNKDRQLVRFSVAVDWSYLIDIKAKLCYFFNDYTANIAPTLVPCKNLKEGYPVIAPLITWEK